MRLVTKKPSLQTDSFTFTADAGVTSHGGSPDGGASAVGNVVVVPDKLAVRVVGFYNHDAGYLTRTYPTDPNSPGVTDPSLSVPRNSVGDQAAITTYGGSITARYEATDRLNIQLRLMGQSQKDNGFPAAFAPLPGFTPVYTLDRAVNYQPTATDKWFMPSLDINYKGDGWSLVSSLSYFYRKTEDLEDSTYGTQQIFASYYEVAGLPNQPYVWDGRHSFKQIVSETRLSFDPIHNISGTFGVYYSHADTDFNIPNTYANGLVAATASNTVVGPWPNDLIWTQNDPGSQEDVSVFGELYYKFLEKFTLTLGGRGYWLKQNSDYTADGFMNFGPTPSDPQHNSQSGFSPKVELAYQATDDAMLYGSASKGFRAGGSQPFAPFCASASLPSSDITNLKSDTLWTYEGGAKDQAAYRSGYPHHRRPASTSTGAISSSRWRLLLAAPISTSMAATRPTINGAEFTERPDASRTGQGA